MTSLAGGCLGQKHSIEEEHAEEDGPRSDDVANAPQVVLVGARGTVPLRRQAASPGILRSPTLGRRRECILTRSGL